MNGNFGDDAACTAYLENLSSHIEIDNITVYPRNNIGYFYLLNNKKVSYVVRSETQNKLSVIREYLKYIKCVLIADYVTVGPCGAGIGILKDERLLRQAWIASFFSKKLVFVLDSINSSNDKEFDKKALKVLKKSVLFVREKSSYDYLKSLGIESKFGVDQALTLSSDYLIDKPKKQIVLIPSNLLNHPHFPDMDFESLIKEKILPTIVNVANKYDCEVSVLPNFRNLKEERAIAEKISNIYIDGKKINLCKPKNVYDFDNEINNSKLVVSMRYHGIVLAVKNNVPVVGISYENKMKEVATYSGISDCILELRNFDNELFERKLNKVMSNTENYKKTMHDFMESDLINSAFAPIDYIINQR